MINTRIILHQAADLVEAGPHLYQQGTDREHDHDPEEPCTCAGLAIADAAGDLPTDEYLAALQAFASFLNLDTDQPFNAIADWNDVPGRTQAEVAQALRAAANQDQ